MTMTAENFWIVVALAVFGGLMFGLALHPGGKKWRLRYDDEVAKRRAAETRVTAVEQELSEERRRHTLRSDEVRGDLDHKPVYISPDAPRTA
ncbi:MAG: hypothetical protein M3R41_04920 [Pseudomonadota bacterium]|nr:hypothetical protein [Pseudomonadota bacterium]